SSKFCLRQMVHNIPLFGKEGLGEIVRIIIFKKSPPPPFAKGGLRNWQNMATNKFVADPVLFKQEFPQDFLFRGCKYLR
ncbi:MAG: hypothetical protein AB1306_10805, partial [Nitrospirota bacterium]